MFVIPEYAKTDIGVYLCHNNIDLIYTQVNDHNCSQEHWYAYLDYLTNNNYNLSFDTMHGG